MTIEKMVAGQRSARNNLIVEVMRDYGYVDARGMGVRVKVLPALKRNGNKPTFEATDDFVRFIVSSTGYGSDRSGETVAKETESHLSGHSDPLHDLLNLLKGQPDAGYRTLAQSLNVSEATVKRNIQKLKQQGRIRRVGSKKSGYWELMT